MDQSSSLLANEEAKDLVIISAYDLKVHTIGHRPNRSLPYGHLDQNASDSLHIYLDGCTNCKDLVFLRKNIQMKLLTTDFLELDTKRISTSVFNILH